MTEQLKIKLILRDNQWLKEFCFQWYSKVITKQSPYWERYALTSYDQFVSLSLIKEILLVSDSTHFQVGYVITPSFEQDILSSIYILPDYRNQGICSEIINILNIKRLSCIRDNINALKLYEKLGFKEVHTNDPFKGSVKMQR